MSPTTASSFDIVEELRTGQMPVSFQQALGRESRVLAETGSLIALPTVSPFFIGHVLVFSKRPFASFADLLIDTPEVQNELTQLLSLYENRLGKAALFEHGSANGGDMACGVSRCHLHFVPDSEIEVSKLISSIAAELGEQQIYSQRLIPEELRGQEYLLLNTPGERSHVWCQPGIPSQLIRKILAFQMGGKAWDWKQLCGWDIVDLTIGRWNRYDSRHHASSVERSLLHA